MAPPQMRADPMRKAAVGPISPCGVLWVLIPWQPDDGAKTSGWSMYLGETRFHRLIALTLKVETHDLSSPIPPTTMSIAGMHSNLPARSPMSHSVSLIASLYTQSILACWVEMKPGSQTR